MNKNLIFLIFLIFSLAKNAIASEIEIKLICKNETNTEEFILRSDSKQTLKSVFKKYKGKFIPIGELVGFKNKSFILFEDKYKSIHSFLREFCVDNSRYATHEYQNLFQVLSL